MKINRNLLILLMVVAISTVAIWCRLDMQVVYQNYDGPYYIAIAKSWYNKDYLGKNFEFNLPLEYYPAHFPLYPLLISAASRTGLTFPQSMIAVNFADSILGAWVVFKVAENLKWKNELWIAIAWLFWWPRMWAVRSVGSPETLFIALAILSLYWFKKKSFWLAAIFGSLAILTKSPGVLLIISYGLWMLINKLKNKRWELGAWPLSLMGLTLVGLFGFYYLQTGDFWAYFHSGDNIHLNFLPFRVFDSSQPWVGGFWLEDVIWVYLISAVGVYRALKKDLVFGLFGAVFLTSILFVSHRDISRYSLPLVPIVLLGFSEIFAKKETKVFLALAIPALFMYTVNFVANNVLLIANWAPLL